MPVGKASFENEKLLGNVEAAISAVNAQKPSGIKGIYVRRLTVTSTMGPGVHVDVASMN